MKNWMWLFLMPYVVTVSTSMKCEEYKGPKDDKVSMFLVCNDLRVVSTYEILLSSNSHVLCHGDATNCDWMNDAAEALNMAHERRIGKQKIEKVGPVIWDKCSEMEKKDAREYGLKGCEEEDRKP